MSKVAGVVSVRVAASGEIHVGILGKMDETPEPIREGVYGCLGELPGWAQERIAILMLTDPNNVDIVKGIGLRTGPESFWLHD